MLNKKMTSKHDTTRLDHALVEFRFGTAGYFALLTFPKELL
jgi:hypothetical protein